MPLAVWPLFGHIGKIGADLPPFAMNSMARYAVVLREEIFPANDGGIDFGSVMEIPE